MSDSRQALQNLHPCDDRLLTAIKMLLKDVFNVTFSTSCVLMFFPRQAPPTPAVHDLLEGGMPPLRCLREGETAERSPAPSLCRGGAGGSGSGRGGSGSGRLGERRKRGTPSEPGPRPPPAWQRPAAADLPGITSSSHCGRGNRFTPGNRPNTGSAAAVPLNCPSSTPG